MITCKKEAEELIEKLHQEILSLQEKEIVERTSYRILENNDYSILNLLEARRSEIVRIRNLIECGQESCL